MGHYGVGARRRLDIRDSCSLSCYRLLTAATRRVAGGRTTFTAERSPTPGPCEVCNAGRTRARQTAYPRSVQARELFFKVASRSLLCVIPVPGRSAHLVDRVGDHYAAACARYWHLHGFLAQLLLSV